MKRRKKGFTLIELMVAISIASIITLGIQELLNTALTSWRVALEEANISRFSDDLINRLLDGDYDVPGLRDAAEIIQAEPKRVVFVPLWTDYFERIPEDGIISLTKNIRKGSSPPIGEIKFKGKTLFQLFPLIANEANNSVTFGFPIPTGSVARVTYHPDVARHPELMMRYEWDSKKHQLTRYYRREISDFELSRQPVPLESIDFAYYDGWNKPIDFKRRQKKEIYLKQITATEIILKFKGNEVQKTARTFVNIRALGKGGPGALLDEGTELRMPGGGQIRLLQLANFSGVSEGQIIELEIKSEKGTLSWRFKMELGVEADLPVSRRYQVFHPSGQLVYENTEILSLNQGFDLLHLDPDDRFDYDEDDGVSDEIKFKGDFSNLRVLKSDPEGVMLIVRP